MIQYRGVQVASIAAVGMIIEIRNCDATEKHVLGVPEREINHGQPTGNTGWGQRAYTPYGGRNPYLIRHASPGTSRNVGVWSDATENLFDRL